VANPASHAVAVPDSPSPSDVRRCPPRVVVFTVILAPLAAAGFVALLALTPSLPTVDLAAGVSGPPPRITETLVLTIATMFMGGMLGGCLYNLRGLIKHSTGQDFEIAHTLSYYLRPISGGISGLIVFFMLLGGAITLNVDGGAAYAWGSLMGRMPYIAFSLLAGYGSHEFMLKLKDLADAIFSLRSSGGGEAS
jgi:hypothetical protein